MTSKAGSGSIIIVPYYRRVHPSVSSLSMVFSRIQKCRETPPEVLESESEPEFVAVTDNDPESPRVSSEALKELTMVEKELALMK